MGILPSPSSLPCSQEVISAVAAARPDAKGIPLAGCERGKKQVEQKKEGFGRTLGGCSSISLAHKASRGFRFPTVRLREDFSFYGKTLGRFVLMDKGVLGEGRITES